MPEQLTLLDAAERLSLILRSEATGGTENEDEYRQLRRRIMVESPEGLIPRCLKVCRTLREFWEFIQPKFPTYAERRAYLKEQFEPLLVELEAQTLRGDAPPPHADGLARIDSAHVRDGWTTAVDRVKDDPDGALTAARTLLESVCKYILDQSDVPYETAEKLPSLYSKCAQQLGIAPSKQVAETMRRIMGSVQQIVEAVGALRNQMSDAHGKGKDSPVPEQHHAELAVNLAGSMAVFMIATWDAQQRASTPDAPAATRL